MANQSSLNVFFNPDAKLIAVIPDDRRKVVINRFSLVHHSSEDNQPIDKSGSATKDSWIASLLDDRAAGVIDQILPGVISNAKLAGAGHYVLISLATRQHVAIYDAVESKITQ